MRISTISSGIYSLIHESTFSKKTLIYKALFQTYIVRLVGGLLSEFYAAITAKQKFFIIIAVRNISQCLEITPMSYLQTCSHNFHHMRRGRLL